MAVSRRAAQRATAARVREARQTGQPYRSVVPAGIRRASRQAQERYARDVASGKEPYPPQGTPEARQLARMGSLSYWGKTDPQFLAAFEQYFYHDEKNRQAQMNENEDVDEYYDEADEDEEAE